MHALSAESVVRIWEMGRDLPPIDRGLAMLSAALPDRPRDAFDAMLIGEQQRLLFRLRAMTFGSAVDGVVDCPHCEERLEFELEPAALLPDPGVATETEVRMDGLELRIRPLRVGDIRDVARLDDPELVRRILGERAVLSARGTDGEVEAADLPDAVIARVSDELARIDAAAEMLIELRCPGCGAVLSPVLDAAELLWSEIRGLAQRLLMEVHTLASAYGWTEREILGLTPARRQAYISLVTG
jgi:hypothetical protein